MSANSFASNITCTNTCCLRCYGAI